MYSINKTCAIKSPFCPLCSCLGSCQIPGSSTKMFLLQLSGFSSDHHLDFINVSLNSKVFLKITQIIQTNIHLLNNSEPGDYLLLWLIWVTGELESISASNLLLRQLCSALPHHFSPTSSGQTLCPKWKRRRTSGARWYGPAPGIQPLQLFLHFMSFHHRLQITAGDGGHI